MKNALLLTLAILGGVILANACNNGKQAAEQNSTRPSEAIPAAPAQQAGNTLKVTNLDLTKGTSIVLADEVNPETANGVIDGIRAANKKSSTKPIFLLLDSPGGSVLDGGRIISAMQASKAPVYTVCLQLCASMAAMILEYGVERYAVDRAIVMFHPASVGAMVQGELDKIVSRFTFFKRYVDKMDHYVASRSGQTYDAFKAQSSQELWIDAEDALSKKLIDKVVRVDISTAYDINFGNNKARAKIQLSW